MFIEFSNFIPMYEKTEQLELLENYDKVWLSNYLLDITYFQKKCFECKGRLFASQLQGLSSDE